MHSRVFLALGLAAVLAACGSTDPLAYESLSGSYSGSFTSTEPNWGQVYVGTFTLQLSQSEAGLTGTWAITGLIEGSVTSEASGPFTATIPLGANPAFTARLVEDRCPEDFMEFSGEYNSSNRTLSLSGSLDIASSLCRVLTAYPLELVLTR